MVSDSKLKEEALEIFADDQTNTFNRIRNSMKEFGDMFLFGKPSEDLLYIMMKIYHENIVRLLNQESDLVGFMCGLIQLDNGDIYITISEDPHEDDMFATKRKALFSILKQTNIKVNNPEDRAKNRFSNPISAWRNTDDGGKTYKRGAISSKERGLEKIMFIDSIGKEKKADYDLSLWKKKYDVNFINSYEYLAARKNENGLSFPPFKKYKNTNDKSGAIIECNNGSTCGESKLFSYIYSLKRDGKYLTFDNIKGFSVFWVGKELPPKHFLGKYGYKQDVQSEKAHLDNVRNECIKILKADDADNSLLLHFKNKYPENFRQVITYVVEMLALACPGCVANYKLYKSGLMSKWNHSHCYKLWSRRNPKIVRTFRLAKAVKAVTRKNKK